MPANLENSVVATGLEKVSFYSNPKERQCQRMFKLLHKCTHLTHLALVHFKIQPFNKTEINVFLELSCFFDDPADVDNLISGSSVFSKTSLNIWKFMVHILLKPGLENLSITLLACEMSTIVW